MKREKCRISYTTIKGKTVAQIDSNGKDEIYRDQLDKINRIINSKDKKMHMNTSNVVNANKVNTNNTTVPKKLNTDIKLEPSDTLIPLDDYISL